MPIDPLMNFVRTIRSAVTQRTTSPAAKSSKTVSVKADNPAPLQTPDEALENAIRFDLINLSEENPKDWLHRATRILVTHSLREAFSYSLKQDQKFNILVEQVAQEMLAQPQLAASLEATLRPLQKQK
jgi:hypothetical protein